MGVLIEEKYIKWEKECEARFSLLKANEEELNRIFIELYGLGGEIPPEVDDEHVSVTRALKSREIRSLLSYAVGCIFGRYSPDREGLCYAGGPWDGSCYRTVVPVENNIITLSVTGTGSDIMFRLTDFVKNVFGVDVLMENMSFIAGALERRGEPKDVISEYFQSGFYSDHLKTYRKRPIYWMVSSGEKKAFRALVYYHRYDPEVFAEAVMGAVSDRMRHCRREMEELEKTERSTQAKLSVSKRLSLLGEQMDELMVFSHRLERLSLEPVSLDAGMGIRYNYGLLSDVLERI